ncbi:MAG: hypothetical protein Q8Q09_25665 [Deltaproteobacteria bacterium]|nr:hypothetical protein [Deltaproteobacteria bacterium]
MNSPNTEALQAALVAGLGLTDIEARSMLDETDPNIRTVLLAIDRAICGCAQAIEDGDAANGDEQATLLAENVHKLAAILEKRGAR